MKLNINIFRRKGKDEAVKRIVGMAGGHGTEPESLHRWKKHEIVERITIGR